MVKSNFEKKKVGLALGGGGAKGLCHIEFCKALDELGVKPVVISGTSIGAIVGGFYAAGVSGNEMKNLADGIGFIDLYKMIDLSLFAKSALLKGKGVEEFLSKHLPVQRFEDLQIPLKIVATDFWGRREVVFKSGKLMTAIRASISIPAIFEPVIIEDKLFIDGGAVNPLPFDIIRNDCDLLIAIDVSGKNKPPRNIKSVSMFESIMTTHQIMQNSILENKKHFAHIDIYVKPELRDIGILDFHKEKEILNSVKDDVEIFKKQLKGKLK